jgi:hypothetical protein
MAKIVRLTERDITRLVKRIISEDTAFDDSPEGLSQYIQQTENRQVDPKYIKKEGDVYVVSIYNNGFLSSKITYKFENGRFVKQGNTSSSNSNEKLLFDTLRNRGVEDDATLNNIKRFYIRIQKSENKPVDWDRERRYNQVLQYIPSWQEYQLMQNMF